MTLQGKLRVFAATVAVAAVAVPVASAKPISGTVGGNGTVQIGGQLVAPAQLSSWQAGSERSSSPRLVQIGGQLVSPEKLSSWQARSERSSSPRLVQIGGQLVSPEKLSSWQASQAKVSSVSTALPSSDSGFGWHDAGIGFGLALGAMLFVGAAMYVRRTRTATPC